MLDGKDFFFKLNFLKKFKLKTLLFDIFKEDSWLQLMKLSAAGAEERVSIYETKMSQFPQLIITVLILSSIIISLQMHQNLDDDDDSVRCSANNKYRPHRR